MWNNKRKEDEYAPRAVSTPPSAPEPLKEGLPLSTAPKTPEFEMARGAASIGKSVTIKGQIFSREDLIVDGEIEGAIELNDHRLTIGPNGRVRAGVKAREIVVLGSIDGNVEGRRQNRHPQRCQARRRYQDGAHHHRRWRLLQGQHRYRKGRRASQTSSAAAASRRRRLVASPAGSFEFRKII